MPFYEYQCQACGAHHEAMQKMSDAPLRACPECGKNALVRLISAPVFRLKGGGWYETDFKSDKEKKRNLAGSEDKPAADTEAASGRRKAVKTVERAGTQSRPAKAPAKKKAAQKVLKSVRVKPKPAQKRAAKTPTKSMAKAKAKAPAKASSARRAAVRTRKAKSATTGRRAR